MKKTGKYNKTKENSEIIKKLNMKNKAFESLSGEDIVIGCVKSKRVCFCINRITTCKRVCAE